MWRKSSRSNGKANCVEIAFGDVHTVLARDSKQGNGPALRFNRSQWQAFLDSM
ncbi:DUF397 domain-containing protein [Actinokineospora inagensis]|uniref:DUF397 domain-containing protein n=1 Tax=Actinokineospora inagensis TaxID=103730 RepID=UPI000A03D095